jgi:hypothetical protein
MSAAENNLEEELRRDTRVKVTFWGYGGKDES